MYHVELAMILKTGEEKSLVEIVSESGAADEEEAAAVAVGLWAAICEEVEVVSVSFKRLRQMRRQSRDWRQA